MQYTKKTTRTAVITGVAVAAASTLTAAPASAEVRCENLTYVKRHVYVCPDMRATYWDGGRYAQGRVLGEGFQVYVEPFEWAGDDHSRPFGDHGWFRQTKRKMILRPRSFKLQTGKRTLRSGSWRFVDKKGVQRTVVRFKSGERCVFVRRFAGPERTVYDSTRPHTAACLATAATFGTVVVADFIYAWE